jgi:predicted transcriptional regulator
MTAIDIKSDIHKKIDIIQDITILNEIYVLLEKQNIKESDFWDDLSPDQKTDIEAGLEDLKAGRKKPYREVLAKYGL